MGFTVVEAAIDLDADRVERHVGIAKCMMIVYGPLQNIETFTTVSNCIFIRYSVHQRTGIVDLGL